MMQEGVSEVGYPPGGSVKRSLAMVLCPFEGAIAKAFGLDAATRRGVRRHQALTWYSSVMVELAVKQVWPCHPELWLSRSPGATLWVSPDKADYQRGNTFLMALSLHSVSQATVGEVRREPTGADANGPVVVMEDCSNAVR